MRLQILFASVALLVQVGDACASPASHSAVSADGVAIRYDSVGRGEPALVFVHCWTCNRGFWDAQVAHFAPRHRVVRLDLAGHGDSGMRRGEYTIDAFADDVAAVVDALGLKRIVLIGHSMGGPVALQAHKALGERVLGVVGVDSFHLGFKLPSGEIYAGRTLFAPGTVAEVVEQISAIMAGAERPMAVSALQGTYRWYQTEAQAAFERIGPRLRNINGDPWGGSLPLHPSVVLIAGAGHFPAQEKPAEFNQALAQIVQEFVDSSIRKSE
jgi:pimeloyl-ACP methyl ester carboxylesterase